MSTCVSDDIADSRGPTTSARLRMSLLMSSNTSSAEAASSSSARAAVVVQVPVHLSHLGASLERRVTTYENWWPTSSAEGCAARRPAPGGEGRLRRQKKRAESASSRSGAVAAAFARVRRNLRSGRRRRRQRRGRGDAVLALRQRGSRRGRGRKTGRASAATDEAGVSMKESSRCCNGERARVENGAHDISARTQRRVSFCSFHFQLGPARRPVSPTKSSMRPRVADPGTERTCGAPQKCGRHATMRQASGGASGVIVPARSKCPCPTRKKGFRPGGPRHSLAAGSAHDAQGPRGRAPAGTTPGRGSVRGKRGLQGGGPRRAVGRR